MTPDAPSQLPPQPRMAMPRTEADFQQLLHLTDEEKAAALKNLSKVPPSDGWVLLGNDPEAQAFFHFVEIVLLKLLQPDIQFIPLGPMNLIGQVVARHTGCEWIAAAMSTTAAGAPQLPEGVHLAQLAMFEFPESALWSDEQRVTLKFAHACLTNTMTDELYEQARQAWGEKRLLRHIIWVGYLHTWTMLFNATNLRWQTGLGDITVQAPAGFAEAFARNQDDSWESLQSLWESWQIATG